VKSWLLRQKSIRFDDKSKLLSGRRLTSLSWLRVMRKIHLSEFFFLPRQKRRRSLQRTSSPVSNVISPSPPPSRFSRSQFRRDGYSQSQFFGRIVIFSGNYSSFDPIYQQSQNISFFPRGGPKCNSPIFRRDGTNRGRDAGTS
jgi:hypothetical protein